MSANELIAIYGGTFSPPHLGHLRAAEAFLRAVCPDKLLIIPSATPPHKAPVLGATDEDRLAMCRLAFSHLPHTEVSDMEIRRQGKSYTVHTLRELAAEGRSLVFLMGTDMFLSLEKWYLFEEIFSLTEIAVMRREADAAVSATLRAQAEKYRARYRARIRFIEDEPFPVSSTELRRRIATGRPYAAYVPAPVAAYIEERGLYRRLTEESLDALREVLAERIGKQRFAHTLGVEQTIAELGALYLPNDILRLRAAALLHDLTKEWSAEQQLAYCRENGIAVSEAAQAAPKVLHALTGAAVAAREFPNLTDPEILGAIARHTVGAPDMSIFDGLLYLADYIEPTRTYPECIALREAFYEGYRGATDTVAHLYRTLLTAFEATEREITARGGVMTPETPATIAALRKKLAEKE